MPRHFDEIGKVYRTEGSRDLIAVRASDLRNGDVCAGSGALVLENRGVSGGKVSLSVTYSRSSAIRPVLWGRSTTMRVWRERPKCPAAIPGCNSSDFGSG